VPGDLTDTAFDDPKLSLRLGRFLDARTPVLLDVQTLSLGDAADTYFADKPEELRAYRRLFDGAVQFLQKKVPRLLVGVTTAAPTESRSPQVAAELNQRSPVLFYTTVPGGERERASYFASRGLGKDWALLAAAGAPIASPVSYSSSSKEGHLRSRPSSSASSAGS
jgi:hypothetical protein